LARAPIAARRVRRVNESLTLPPGWIAATVAAIAVQVVTPIVAAGVVGRRLGVGWRFFGYGALIFLAFQMLTRVPLVQVGQVLFQDALNESPVLTWVWIGLLALSAGLFEEVGRWVGYRWLFHPEQRRWREGAMYGLGHGGLESMVLIGGLSALSLAGLLALQGADALAQVPPEQREIVQAQLAALGEQPAWFPLLGAWERLSALALHVGLSLFVLRAFVQGGAGWVGVAVLIHAAVNFVAVALLRVLGAGVVGALTAEVSVMLMAGATLWFGLRLHRPDHQHAA
jgi:uncharacterized membrane protein YhfC